MPAIQPKQEVDDTGTAKEEVKEEKKAPPPSSGLAPLVQVEMFLTVLITPG